MALEVTTPEQLLAMAVDLVVALALERSHTADDGGAPYISCVYCGQEIDYRTRVLIHTPTCPTLQAQAWLRDYMRVCA